MMIRERGASERKKREREERERREAGRENRAEKKKGERKRAEEKRERFQQQIDRGLRARPHRAPTARRHDVCRRPPPEGKNSFPSPLSLSRPRHACVSNPPCPSTRCGQQPANAYPVQETQNSTPFHPANLPPRSLRRSSETPCTRNASTQKASSCGCSRTRRTARPTLTSGCSTASSSRT